MLKKNIFSQLNILDCEIQLFFQGNPLSEDQILSDLGVDSNSTITFIVHAPKKATSSEIQQNCFDYNSVENRRKLLFLLNLGYRFEWCQASLMMSQGHLALAANLLYSGGIPDSIEREIESTRKEVFQAKRAAILSENSEKKYQLTFDDDKIIEKLVRHGFDRKNVINVYISCGKNETLTLNTLLK